MLSYGIVLLVLQRIPDDEPYTARAFCADLAHVCRSTTSQLEDIRKVATKACMDESWTVDASYLNPSDRTWLHDVACDATKLISDTGGLGYVTIEANESTPVKMAWGLLMQVCAKRPRCFQRRLAPSRNLQTQSQSLLGLTALYVATNGGGWTANTNWLQGEPCPSGNWQGLTCSGNVLTEVYLKYNNLGGTLPTEIGYLQEMTGSFQLHSNSFIGGTIPTQVGLLAKLTGQLRFAVNQLSGSLPTQLGHLTALSHSFLADGNLLSGTIPTELGLLGQLSFGMYLFGNRLSGTIPSELQNLSPTNCLWTNEMAWNPNAPNTNRFACPIPPLSSSCLSREGNSLTCLSPPTPPPLSPPPPPSGAVLELTGDEPRITFGSSTVCEISLDRINNQLVSTCPFESGGRRLEKSVETPVIERVVALETENDALKTQLVELKTLLVELKVQVAQLARISK
jgi:hypothetical protein